MEAEKISGLGSGRYIFLQKPCDDRRKKRNEENDQDDG